MASHGQGNKVAFGDVALFYPQVIDYLRLALVALAACTCVHEEWDSATACFLLYSVALDYVDGKLARRYNQCSVVGDGLDWTADVCTSWVFVMWWGRLERCWQPWAALATMAETGAAIFDFAMLATEQYEPRPPQRGFFVVLEALAPAGRWTWAGYGAWLASPLWCTVRCLSLYALSECSVTPYLAWVQAALALPAATYVWYNVALLASCLVRWRERPRSSA